jgi:anti-sigma B factor antagonist
MQIDDDRVNGISVLQIKGRIDVSNAKLLKTKVQELIGHGAVNFLIAMEKVDYIDSSGLGILVACLKAANAVGGTVKISGLKQYPKQVFQTMRLDRVFQLYDESAQALNAF